MTSVRTNPSAFVSWAHGGEGWTAEDVSAWAAEVRRFVHLLRALGIDVDADIFHASEPGVNWSHFGPNAVATSDFTIVVVSEPWKERWEGKNDPAIGAGAVAEANALHGMFARSQREFAERVVLVELPSVSRRSCVPDGLSGYQRFALSAITETGCEPLIRLLTNQPKDPLPPLGPVPLLPPLPPAYGSDERSKDQPAAAGASDDATRRTSPVKGRRFPPDPITEEDVAALFAYLNFPRSRFENSGGLASRYRLRAFIAVLWRAGLRFSEAHFLELDDLRRRSNSILIQDGIRRTGRQVTMDPWGWSHLDAWLEIRSRVPDGPIFCAVQGATAGTRIAASSLREQLHAAAQQAGVTRRVAPHQFRHAHALDLYQEGVDVRAIQRQLGVQELGRLTSLLESLETNDTLSAIARRRAPAI